MKEIFDYLSLQEKCKKYEVEIVLFNDQIRLVNKKKLLLGCFVDASTAYSYILGYESGIIDSPLYDEE
ncbi:hypothetical protein ZPAH1_orf00164 [Aeromonas phage ZPAH1]|nr:hypothetical protein ZPAH1_orf00164 [Aeromonas phage ZPAH1]